VLLHLQQICSKLSRFGCDRSSSRLHQTKAITSLFRDDAMRMRQLRDCYYRGRLILVDGSLDSQKHADEIGLAPRNGLVEHLGEGVRAVVML
jgi:hypothetical protein